MMCVVGVYCIFGLERVCDIPIIIYHTGSGRTSCSCYQHIQRESSSERSVYATSDRGTTNPGAYHWNIAPLCGLDDCLLIHTYVGHIGGTH